MRIIVAARSNEGLANIIASRPPSVPTGAVCPKCSMRRQKFELRCLRCQSEYAIDTRHALLGVIPFSQTCLRCSMPRSKFGSECTGCGAMHASSEARCVVDDREACVVVSEHELRLYDDDRSFCLRLPSEGNNPGKTYTLGVVRVICIWEGWRAAVDSSQCPHFWQHLRSCSDAHGPAEVTIISPGIPRVDRSSLSAICASHLDEAEEPEACLV